MLIYRSRYDFGNLYQVVRDAWCASLWYGNICHLTTEHANHVTDLSLSQWEKRIQPLPVSADIHGRQESDMTSKLMIVERSVLSGVASVEAIKA